jgi:hypothetical protein
MENGLFLSAVRTDGDYAGVFEHDGEAGYFYLYELHSSTGNKIISAMHILDGLGDLGPSDLRIGWDQVENRVALFVKNEIVAVFNVSTGGEHGGKYSKVATQSIPENERFNCTRDREILD